MANPTNNNAINGTHRLVYGAKAVWIENPALNPLLWVNPDCGPFVTAANWSAAPAYDATDSFIIPPTGGTCVLPNPGAGNTRSLGDLTVNNGTLLLPASRQGTYRFVAAGGTTGSLIMTGPSARFAGSAAGAPGDTWDFDGSFIYNPTVTAAISHFNGSTIRMRGVGVTYQVQNSTETYNHVKRIIIDNGAVVNFAAGLTGKNAVVNLDVWGTATGPVFTSIAKTAKIFRGPSADTSNLDVSMSWYENDWGAGNTNVRNAAGVGRNGLLLGF